MRYYTWIMLFFLFTSCTHHQAVKSNQRGMDYITREQPRKALEEFNHAISLDPDFFSAYYNRAIIRANLKQNEEALKDINYVIANQLTAGFIGGIPLPRHRSLWNERLGRSPR